MACESYIAQHFVDSVYFLPKISLNFIVVAHLVIPAGWGSYPPRLDIFYNDSTQNISSPHDFLFAPQSHG